MTDLSNNSKEKIEDLEIDSSFPTRNAVMLLKALAHEGRLMILKHLAEGEKTVSELERLLSLRQAAVSQQLARLRFDGLVLPRRDGQMTHYRLSDDNVAKIIHSLHKIYS